MNCLLLDCMEEPCDLLITPDSNLEPFIFVCVVYKHFQTIRLQSLEESFSFECRHYFLQILQFIYVYYSIDDFITILLTIYLLFFSHLQDSQILITVIY